MKRQTPEKSIAEFLQHVRESGLNVRCESVRVLPDDVEVYFATNDKLLRLSLLSLIQKRYPRKPAKKKVKK